MPQLASESEKDKLWNRAVDCFRHGDRRGALYLFYKLARLGEEAAFVEIGNIYEAGGGGIQKDVNRAIKWYRKSLFKAGHVEGGVRLARCYYLGVGVGRDYTKAFMLYKEAADDAKHMEACLMVARMYWLGQGVSSNEEGAKNYYLCAHKSGSVYATYELGLLKGRSNLLIRLFFGVWASMRYLIIRIRNKYDRRLSPAVINNKR